MAIQKETIKAMVRDYHGFELSDEEIELIRPELDSYLDAVEQLQELDLSSVMSVRLLRADEGGQS
jgi:Asp-tRNA(Asn)/Glu-tRNA(Gln) amidotransferase C subunit